MASSVLNVFVSKYLHLVEASLYFSLSIALSSKEKSRSINRKMFILLEILTKFPFILWNRRGLRKAICKSRD